MLLIFAGMVGSYQYRLKFSIYFCGTQKLLFCVHLITFTAVFFLLLDSEPLYDIDVNMNATKTTKIFWKEFRSQFFKQLLLLALHCEQILQEKSLIVEDTLEIIISNS